MAMSLICLSDPCCLTSTWWDGCWNCFKLLWLPQVLQHFWCRRNFLVWKSSLQKSVLSAIFIHFFIIFTLSVFCFSHETTFYENLALGFTSRAFVGATLLPVTVIKSRFEVNIYILYLSNRLVLIHLSKIILIWIFLEWSVQLHISSTSFKINLACGRAQWVVQWILCYHRKRRTLLGVVFNVLLTRKENSFPRLV